MKASEIVTKIKDVLLSTNSEEEVIASTNEVELKEEASVEEAKVETSDVELNTMEEEYQDESEMTHTPDHEEYVEENMLQKKKWQSLSLW